MLFYPLFVVSKALFPHLEGNTNIYSVGDPGVLLVNLKYPSEPLTAFEYEKEKQYFLPVGLHEISEEVLKFQVWHFYYESSHKHFWFELEFDKKVKIGVDGNLMQGNRISKNPTMNAVKINEKYFKIINEDKCLEVQEIKSNYRDSYPLKFKKCRDTPLQAFSLVSKMKALCVLKSELCPSDKKDVIVAEKIVRERLSHFAALYDPQINGLKPI